MPRGLKSLARTLDAVPFAPVVAVLFGLVAGILVAATPGWLLERGVAASGLPDLIAAAAPPLGNKARIMAVAVAAFGTAAVLWLVLMPIGKVLAPGKAESQGDHIEDDSSRIEHPPHPDAPARRPLFAESDLGAPFMSDEAIAHARDELVLETPLVGNPEPIEEIAAETVTDAVEQIEEPEPQEAPEPVTAPVVIAQQASIAGLLDRLENALERREQRTGSTAPILPGDLAALRKALGDSIARH